MLLKEDEVARQLRDELSRALDTLVQPSSPSIHHVEKANEKEAAAAAVAVAGVDVAGA